MTVAGAKPAIFLSFKSLHCSRPALTSKFDEDDEDDDNNIIMIGISPLPSILSLVVVSTVKAGNLRSSIMNNMKTTLERPRDLQTVVTTMECSKIRDEPYKGSLTLNYKYCVDTFPNGLLDLPAVEEALVQAVAARLDTCDEIDRPRYAIAELNDSHTLSPNESCTPKDKDNLCHVVDGSTTILLDTGVTTAKELAYDAIKAALNDAEYIGDFAPAVASASLLEKGRDSFVVSPPSTGNDGSSGTSITTTVSIASASVAFVLVSIFLYGMFRRMPMSRIKGLSSPIGKGSPGHIGIKPAGNYYEGLDDEHPSLFHLDIEGDSPSHTWSVSDITSEGSIRSGLSRGTSTLERIDEETLDEIELYEDEEDDENTEPDLAPRRSPDSISHFIATFDAVDRRNTSDDNGPHHVMESMDMSREDLSGDEAVCTIVPVGMSSEEAQHMLDTFLFPLSQAVDDVEVVSSSDKPQKDGSVDEDVAKEHSEEVTSAKESAVPDSTLKCTDETERALTVENTEAKDRENLKVSNEVDRDLYGNAEEENARDLEDSSVSNEEDAFASIRTATAGKMKVERDVEDNDTPAAPEEAIGVTCAKAEAFKSPLAVESKGGAVNGFATSPREVTATAVASSTASDNPGKQDAPVVSPDRTCITNTKETVASEPNNADTNEACRDKENAQDGDAETDEEKNTKETIDGNQSTIDRVVSLEEPIGLAVHETLFEVDSLALSTYSTESDEEVSVSSFLAKFLAGLSTDGMGATECQPPGHSKDDRTKE